MRDDEVEWSEDHSHQVWFITGAARGLGRELVREALIRGDFVLAADRRIGGLAEAFADYAHALVALDLDLDDPQEVRDAVNTAVRCFGHIDLLVCNAASGLIGAVEEAGDLEVRRLFDDNVFGQLSLMREVLPVLRDRRRGHVILLSSATPDQPEGQGLTMAAAGALMGLADALRQELRPLGIRVTAVKADLSGHLSGDLAGDRAEPSVARQILNDYAPQTRQARQGLVVDHDALACRAQALVATVSMTGVPGLIVLGEQAYERAIRHLSQLHNELSLWRDVAPCSTRAA